MPCQYRCSAKTGRTVVLLGIGPHPLDAGRGKAAAMTDVLAGRSDDDLLAIFDPMMDNCLAGSNGIDHARHVRDFTERLRRIVTRESLEAQCADYQPRLGYFGRREFVCLFRRETSVAVVWRQYFTKSDDEFVNQANFVLRDGRVLIDHCLIC